MFADLVNGADVGMVQGGGSASFASKALEGLRVPCQVFGQKLQGNKTPQLGIFGFVHDTHTATAKFFEDAVVRNRLANHRPESYVDETLEVNQSRQDVVSIYQERS